MTVNTTAIMVDDEEEEATELFTIMYHAMVYLLALFVAGDLFCGRLLRVIPPLVGQIGIGVLLGPNGGDFIRDTVTTWPLLGEIGLVLLMCQAGLEMDFQVLRQVGPRGVVMAMVGSALPTAIGFSVSYFAFNLSASSALAVGCSFGPTSAGIALNVLQPGGVLKTPLGQLVVAIAIVDDLIALVVLSQLRALIADTFSASAIAVPIISALLWLFVGGAIALYVMPKVLSQLTNLEQKIVDRTLTDAPSTKCKEINPTLSAFQLAHITVLLFALLPATYYSKASHLLGAFLAGLSACQQSNSAQKYNHELDKIINWLLRLFFGASIAFVIPVRLFQDGTVIARGFLLSLALLGKITTGLFLTPVQLDVGITSGANRHFFDRAHRRDCLVVGFSMAGEAEFAMLVAGFGYSEGLLTEDIYASTVFAILLSTILSPCLLRLTLACFLVEQDQHDNKSNGADIDPSDDKEVEVP